jgi:hypothetical protein
VSTALFDLLDEIRIHRPEGAAPRVGRLVSDHRPGQHIVYRLEDGAAADSALSVDGADRYWALIDLGSHLFVQGNVELDPKAARAIAAELVAWADYREGEGAL